MMLILSGVSVIVLSGCGGGSSSDDYYAPEVTYYLQTEDAFGDFLGVDNVYYECGPDIVGYTGEYGASGSFTMVEGDLCTFYDLDNTLSFDIDVLYIGLDAEGTIGIEPTPYNCDSDISDITDDLGGFVFDPYYINALTIGDICEFSF